MKLLANFIMLFDFAQNEFGSCDLANIEHRLKCVIEFC